VLNYLNWNCFTKYSINTYKCSGTNSTYIIT